MNEQPPQTSETIRLYRDYLLNSEDYEPVRQRYLKRRVFDTFDQLLRHRGRPGLQPGMRLIDLGSADGMFGTVCNEAGLQASSLDISDNINFETDTLPLQTESFDVVTSISVIEHLYSPMLMLSESWRVLRPGGAIIVVCPNWQYCKTEFYDDPTHVHPYTRESLRWVLDEQGFTDCYVVPWVVKKPAWVWDMPFAFFVTARLIPFRGTAPDWIPRFLKGRTGTLLALAFKPSATLGEVLRS